MHQRGSLLPSATCFAVERESREKERRTERRRGAPSSYATAPRRRCITGTEEWNSSHSQPLRARRKTEEITADRRHAMRAAAMPSPYASCDDEEWEATRRRSSKCRCCRRRDPAQTIPNPTLPPPTSHASLLP
nr:hypothetical protein Itr_chr11CG15800 [Ipomoea trifida]